MNTPQRLQGTTMLIPSKKAASLIYDILIEECGAPSNEYGYPGRSYFVDSQVEENGCIEFRFMGDFGFGGKFWNSGDRWYVNAHTEEETPEVKKQISQANERLALLRQKFRAGLV